MDLVPRRMIARGLRCRCPRCGGRHLFSGWFTLKERCPTCGMKFEREEGFWLGGYVINFGTGEAFLLILLGLLIGFEANGTKVAVWPFVAGGLAIAVVGPLLTFRPSRTLWSAIDLIMRPLTPEEIVESQAVVAEAAMRDATPEGQAPGGP